MQSQQVQPWMLKAKRPPKQGTTKPELRPDTVGSVMLKEVKGLPGAFTLVMAGEGRQDQLTFHRPIGFTDLDQDEWVCSATADIPTLLAGAVDPREAQISKMETQVFLEILVKRNYLAVDEDGWHHYPNGDCRESILQDADNEVRDRLAELKKAHDAKQQGKQKAAVWHGQNSVSRADVLAEVHNEYEKEIREMRKSCRDEIREKVPRTYRTLGGPLRDRPQKACPIIPKGSGVAEAYGLVNKAISYALLQGDAKTSELQLAQSAREETSTKLRVVTHERDVLKQEHEAQTATIATLMAKVAALEAAQKKGGPETGAAVKPAAPGAKAPPSVATRPPPARPKPGTPRGPPPDVDTPRPPAEAPPVDPPREDADDEDPVPGDNDIVEEVEIESTLASLPPSIKGELEKKLKPSGDKITWKVFDGLMTAAGLKSRRAPVPAA